MEKEERIDIKIKRLFRAAGNPRYVHHYGPKKFETWILCLGIVVKQKYQLSYRRLRRFLDEYFGIQIHWTTLQKAANRFPRYIWQSLMAATVEVESVPIAAIDGTGFSRSGPSHYYLKRIDRKETVGRPVQCIAMVDVNQRKFIAGTFFAKPHSEVRKTPTLYRQSPVHIDTILMDKGFDAEWLHQWLNKHGSFAVIPARKNCRHGKFRKLMRDCMDWYLYWQRNIVESLFSALKRLFGSTVKSRGIRTQTAELFCRLIAYNIGILSRLFLQSRNAQDKTVLVMDKPNTTLIVY